MTDFDSDFVWGVSTSAFQIEGASAAGGRGESIWDRFAARPGAIADGSDGSIATGHVARLDEDLDLLVALGVDAYRFSVSWPRLAPSGRGRFRTEGVAFYDRVVDGLLARGVEPWLCLYHWDLPQVLQDAGGWANRDTAEYFADHVEGVAELFADRVEHWFALNEPNVHAVLGHLLGLHAPGSSDIGTFLAAVHHQNLATGLAVERLRATVPDLTAGTIVNLQPVAAGVDGEEHEAAAALVDAAYNRACLDPLLLGRYPQLLEDMLEPYVREGDLTVIAAPLDVLGVNHYTRLFVRADDDSPVGLTLTEPPQGSEVTAMGWEVAPAALERQLVELKDRYGNPPVVVTENGAAFPDRTRSRGDGRIEDRDRVAYLIAYLRALKGAMEAGCDVRGYFAWTLVDNFEWASGFTHRFGLVELERPNLTRRPKASFEAYREIVASGVLPDD